jgi:hypothetical protein
LFCGFGQRRYWLIGVDTVKKLVFYLAIVLLISGCKYKKIGRDARNTAFQRALDFSEFAFLERDYEKAYLLVSKDCNATFEEFSSGIDKIHPNGFPVSIKAGEYESITGEEKINIYLFGRNYNEKFYYRFVMQRTEEDDYRVLSLHRSNTRYPRSKHTQKLITIVPVVRYNKDALLAEQNKLAGQEEPCLRGFVCDKDGKALPSATVLTNMHIKVELDDDGNFFIPEKKLQTGGSAVLLLAQADKDGQKLRCAQFVDYITGQENITLRLQNAATIQGRILSSDDEAIAGAKVVAFINVGSLTCHGTSQTGSSDVTNDSGHFTLTGLYPNTRYRLFVRAAGFERKWSDWISLGQQIYLKLEIVLRVAPGSVSGRLLNKEGEPIPAIKVILGHPCIPDDVCETDQAGHFKFNDLVQGEKVSIHAVGKDIRDVSVGTADLEIRIEEPDK